MGKTRTKPGQLYRLALFQFRQPGTFPNSPYIGMGKDGEGCHEAFLFPSVLIGRPPGRVFLNHTYTLCSPRSETSRSYRPREGEVKRFLKSDVENPSSTSPRRRKRLQNNQNRCHNQNKSWPAICSSHVISDFPFHERPPGHWSCLGPAFSLSEPDQPSCIDNHSVVTERISFNPGKNQNTSPPSGRSDPPRDVIPGELLSSPPNRL